jgi:hypothetical protein
MPRSASACVLREVTVGDFSYFERHAEAIYTRIGKFCSIAANTRINALEHPDRAGTQHKLSYRPNEYFRYLGVDEDFRERRQGRQVTIGNDVWIGHGAVVMPGVSDRQWRGGRRQRGRDEGRRALRDRRRQKTRRRGLLRAAVCRGRSPRGSSAGLVGLAAGAAVRGRSRHAGAADRGVSRQVGTRMSVCSRAFWSSRSWLSCIV